MCEVLNALNYISLRLHKTRFCPLLDPYIFMVAGILLVVKEPLCV